MEFQPPRRIALTLASLIGLMLLASSVFGLIQLGRAEVSAWLVAWVVMPFIGLPAALWTGYEVYSLATAQYRIDRNGFSLRWGLAREHIPIRDIQDVRLASQWHNRARLRPGWAWPIVALGQRRLSEAGEVEFFAAGPVKDLVMIESKETTLVISPQDPQGFIEASHAATRQGPLENSGRISERPDFLVIRLWRDLAARGTILTGFLGSLSLLGFLAAQAASLPRQIPFGFTPLGEPSAVAPPGRLLLLPFIAGLCWLADLLLGMWFYRRPEGRPMAYGLWILGVVTGGLVWGAALHLLSVA